jgi:hypothetical protein
MKKCLILILVIIPVVFGFSGKYHAALLLDLPVNNNTSAEAMGGLTVLPPVSASNASLAPASINTKPGFFGCLSLGLSQQSEMRQRPLYDTFSSLIGWTAYANNKSTMAIPSFFAGYSLKGEWSGAVSVGYAQLQNADFTYREEVRDRDGILEDTYFVESEGTLSGPAIALNGRLSHWGRLGLGIVMASGTLKMKRSSMDTRILMPYESPLLSDSSETELSATVMTLDLVATPTERLEIGLKYTPKATLDENTIYPPALPGRFGIGIAYKPSGHLPSRVVFETEHVAWADLGDDDSSYQALENKWAFRFGIEHKFPNGSQMRAGAFHYIIPLEQPVARTGMTAGAGFKVFNHVRMDLMAGYMMSKYEMHPLFGSLPSDSSASITYDRVRESSLYGGASVTVEF